MTFNDSKYTRWYWQIVNKARERVLETYTEKHHVIPESLEGGDESTNLVNLTAREHFVVHWLLTKMTVGKDKQKMFHALAMMMTDRDGNRNLTPKQYEICKKARSKAMRGHVKSVETRRKLSEARRGKPRDETTKAKISASLTGKKQSQETIQKRVSKNTGQMRTSEQKARMLAGRSPDFRHSEESKRKMSESRRGKKPSEEANHKRALAMKGFKHTAESKAKMSLAAKNRKKKS